MVHVPWQPGAISGMVSLQSKISSTLPRFDDLGDVMMPHEAGTEGDVKGLDAMGNLERELLVSQLSDLDNWIHQVRDANELKGRPLPPPIDEEELAPPGVESLLRAQVQELEGWMIECRSTADSWRAASEPTTKLQETDEELMLAVRRERMWSVRKTPAPKDETAHAQQRLESAFETLSHMREAETQRSLALEQVRSVSLQTAEDFTRLHSQLHELEADPMRAPELARYAPTDVALALVGAIEQRCALAGTLRDALRAQEKVKVGAEAFEQLLSCAAAWPVAFQVAEQEGAESPEITYAPASLLTFPGAPLGDGSTDIQDVQIARLHKLAERNRLLWEQAYAHWEAASRSKGLIEMSRRGGKMVSFEPEGNASALQSELVSLRAAEGRLDQLLGGGTGAGSPGGMPTQRFNVAAALSHLPGLSSIEEKHKMDNFSKEKELPGLGKMSLGPFAILSMEIIFDKWFQKAHLLQHWRRTRRQEACAKFLHSRIGAKALRYMIARLTVNVECSVAENMAKGERVRDVKTNRIGTFCSRTPKGVCKIQWGPTEASLRPVSELTWLTVWPHPALGGICFLAWQQIMVIHENKAVARFREKVKDGHESKKSSKMLVWLSASASEDMTDMVRLIVVSWRKASSFKKQERQDMVAEAFLVWRHGAIKSRHARAVNALQSTSSELRDARMSVARHKYRFDKLQVKLNKIDDMEKGLYLSYVLSSWLHAVQMERMEYAVNMSSRAERIKVGIQLSDTMQKQKYAAMLPGVFTAWAMRTLQRTQAKNKQAVMSMAFTGASLRVAFTEWRMLVQGDKKLSAEHEIQKVNSLLVDKNEEFEKLQMVTEELYGFSREADARVKQLEDALGAADKAIEAGVQHGQVLEKEVSSLETQLQAIEARVRRGDEAERELRVEREEKAALKMELGSVRSERENISNRMRIMETKMKQAEADLEEEKRRAADGMSEKTMLERALEDAREEAASWKLQVEVAGIGGGGGGGFGAPLPPPPAPPGFGGGFAAAGVGAFDVDDILSRVDKDGDGNISEKELKRAIKKGIVTEDEAEQAARKIQVAFRRSFQGGATAPSAAMNPEDPRTKEAKERVWQPEGDYLPPMNTLMDYEKAANYVELGADFIKVTPGTIFSSKEKLYFAVFEGSDEKFMCYYKEQGEKASGVARGAFALKDIAMGTWDGKLRTISLFQSAKKDGVLRQLIDVPPVFFEALMVVVREAEFRRLHTVFHGNDGGWSASREKSKPFKTLDRQPASEESARKRGRRKERAQQALIEKQADTGKAPASSRSGK